MVTRILNPLKINSFFLLGPRGSGKSTWLQATFTSEQSLYLDLLDPDLYESFLLNPKRLESVVLDSSSNHNKIIILDEIQRVPKLLDVVHRLIQKHKIIFILTGSSSRKLKQKGANLLAGRAHLYRLYPLTMIEIKAGFQLQKCLECGALPDAYFSQSDRAAHEYLKAYVHLYLEKEIQQEQWVRQIELFRKFLPIAAQMNGKIINRSKIAKEIGIDPSTVASYYEILEDTLLGFELPAFHRSVRVAQRQASKFYFIDPGIKRAIEKSLTVSLLPQTSAYGEAFEHWVILELIKMNEYLRLDYRFSYLCTKDDLELDLVIERPGRPLLLIEIKSKSRVDESDTRAFKFLADDLDPKAEQILLSQDPVAQKIGKVKAFPWDQFIKNLYSQH